MVEERPGETEVERADRNFGDLLQELRVAQTGVQILFAFLLTMPLQSRFDSLDAWDRRVFVAALLLSALATTCLIAPVAFHRLLFRRHMKDWVVRSASRLAQAGLALLALAITAALTLVLDLVVSRPLAVALSGGVAAVIVVLWYAVPLARRGRT